MKTETIIIATIKSWNIENANRFKFANMGIFDVQIITNPDDLLSQVEKSQPKFIFFPHWSWKIEEAIYKKYECILFHPTDLPFGRGGTPIQNQITLGITHTVISAIQVSEEIDGGPVYFKEPFCLSGTVEEILIRMSDIIFEKMIPTIINERPKPIEQTGSIIKFKRRIEKESNIEGIHKINDLYNHIRMLDGEGYPKAYFETDEFVFEFSRASIKNDGIYSDVHIKRRAK